VDEPRNNGVIIGGVYHSCAAPVRTWHDHGLELKIGNGARKRKKGVPIDTFVVHVSGAEQTAKTKSGHELEVVVGSAEGPRTGRPTRHYNHRPGPTVEENGVRGW
jgi:hypothetical protein